MQAIPTHKHTPFCDLHLNVSLYSRPSQSLSTVCACLFHTAHPQDWKNVSRAHGAAK